MIESPRVLVVGPSWVGDMVMAQALFRDLSGRHSAMVIDVVAPPWSVPVLARMDEVRRGIPLAVGHGEVGLRTRFRLGRSLAAEGYEQAIVLPRSAKSALVPFFAGVPKRTGFRGELRYGLINDMRPFDRQVLDQTVKRFRALGLEDPAASLPPLAPPRLRADPARRDALVLDFGLRGGPESSSGPVVALMPGAEYGPAKQWPTAHYRGLASRLVDAGAEVWIFGGSREQPLGTEIAAGLSGVHDLCGRTSLTDVIDLLSAADAAVSNDSGLMHVAAAVGVHVIGIYGSSSPSFTPPLTESKTIMYRHLSCSPCFERNCPLGHTDCLNGIGVDEVFATVIEGARR